MNSPLDLRKSTAVVALALFLFGQLFVTAHGLEYGTEPHGHNGVVCLAILSHEQDSLPPNAQSPNLHVVLNESKIRASNHQVLFPTRPAVKPPSTGPPRAG